MMINCELHGIKEAISASPDLEKSINDKTFIKPYINVHYEYDNEIIETFYLTDDFAKKFGLSKDEVLPLPDNYPEWVNAIVPVCLSCLHKSLDDE